MQEKIGSALEIDTRICLKKQTKNKRYGKQVKKNMSEENIKEYLK